MPKQVSVKNENELMNRLNVGYGNSINWEKVYKKFRVPAHVYKKFAADIDWNVFSSKVKLPINGLVTLRNHINWTIYTRHNVITEEMRSVFRTELNGKLLQSTKPKAVRVATQLNKNTRAAIPVISEEERQRIFASTQTDTTEDEDMLYSSKDNNAFSDKENRERAAWTGVSVQKANDFYAFGGPDLNVAERHALLNEIGAPSLTRLKETHKHNDYKLLSMNRHISMSTRIALVNFLDNDLSFSKGVISKEELGQLNDLRDDSLVKTRHGVNAFFRTHIPSKWNQAGLSLVGHIDLTYVGMLRGTIDSTTWVKVRHLFSEGGGKRILTSDVTTASLERKDTSPITTDSKLREEWAGTPVVSSADFKEFGGPDLTMEERYNLLNAVGIPTVTRLKKTSKHNNYKLLSLNEHIPFTTRVMFVNFLDHRLSCASGAISEEERDVLLKMVDPDLLINRESVNEAFGVSRPSQWLDTGISLVGKIDLAYADMLRTEISPSTYNKLLHLLTTGSTSRTREAVRKLLHPDDTLLTTSPTVNSKPTVEPVSEPVEAEEVHVPPVSGIINLPAGTVIVHGIVTVVGHDNYVEHVKPVYVFKDGVLVVTTEERTVSV